MAYLIMPITIISCSSGGNETIEKPVKPPEVTKKELRSVSVSMVLPKLRTLVLTPMTTNIITVNVDGKDYNLKKAFTFVID